MSTDEDLLDYLNIYLYHKWEEDAIEKISKNCPKRKLKLFNIASPIRALLLEKHTHQVFSKY